MVSIIPHNHIHLKYVGKSCIIYVIEKKEGSVIMGISFEKIEKWEKKKKFKKLISVLNIDDHEIRIRAIRALSGFDSLDVINSLVNLLRDPNPEIRIAAVETLGKIGSGKAMEFVRFMLERESEENVKEAAKNALAAIKDKMKQDEIA